MKKDMAILNQKLESIVVYIEDHLKQAREFELTNPLRTEYAIDLAVKLRVLLNDENANISLLRLLKIKDDFRFQALVEENALINAPSNMCYSSLLTSLCITNEGLYCKSNEYQPTEDLLLTFDTWWNEIVIDSKSAQLSQISRRDIVLTLADKEGGAHVDSNYDEAYYQAVKTKGIVLITPNGEERTVQNDTYAEAMLFIAKEFLNAYYIHKNLKPYKFRKKSSSYKILQLTYFRAKKRKQETVFEKRYRFLRYKNGNINDAIMFLFDYYQLASYRLLELYQISNRFPNGDFIYAHVVDFNSHSDQIIYARTEDCTVHRVLLKNGANYIPIEVDEAVPDKNKYRSFEEVATQLNPDNPHAFDVYLSKQVVEEPC